MKIFGFDINLGSLFSTGLKAIGGWSTVAIFAAGMATGAYPVYKLMSLKHDASMLEIVEAQRDEIIRINEENTKKSAEALARKDAELQALAEATINAIDAQKFVEEQLEELQNAPKEDDRILSDTSQQFFERLREQYNSRH